MGLSAVRHFAEQAWQQRTALLMGWLIIDGLIWRFAGLLWLWHETVRLFILLELSIERGVRWLWRPAYVLQGSCQRRGLCCENILFMPPRWLLHWPPVVKAWLLYHRFAHRFYVKAHDEQGGFVLRCGHLQSDGQCGNYRYRPRLCRNYPLQPLFAPPALLPGCNYQVVARVLAHRPAHPRLRIINKEVMVFHPTPPRGQARQLPEDPGDFQRLDPAG